MLLFSMRMPRNVMKKTKLLRGINFECFQLSSENKKSVNTTIVNYLCKKPPSQIFDRVLNTPLVIDFIFITTSIKNNFMTMSYSMATFT